MNRWRLFDDPRADALYPLTRLRPAAALLLGAETAEERWRRCLGAEDLTVVCRAHLAALASPRVAFDALEATGGDLCVSDLLIADESMVAKLRDLAPGEAAFVEDEPVAWRASKTMGLPSSRSAFREVASDWKRALELSSASMLRGLADLVRLQPRVLETDLERLVASVPAGNEFGDAQVYCPEHVRVAPGTRLDHGVVLDARDGPIVLGPDIEVSPHTWILGPFYARGESRFLGGRIGGGSSFGRQCRVRGEVDSSVFLGYDNKAHDGFVGHSYLGEWVNLGALTTTSDLKNNYSEISLKIDGRTIRTGTNKVGSFLGDHAKTRIGCLLNTGSVIGVGANLIGEPAVPTAWVPAFSWGAGESAQNYDLQKFLATAEIVMKRRGVELDDAHRAALQRAYDETAPARERPAR